MNNLKILLKNELNLLIGRVRGKQAKMSTFTAGILLGVGIVGLLALYSFQAYTMMDAFHKMGVEKIAVFHGLTTALTVAVIIGVIRISAKSKSSDTELLLSMPIKKSTILIVKTISKYVFDFFFVFMLLAPYLVLYLIFAGFDVMFLITGLLIVLLLPLMSLGISYIMDFVTTRLFNKIRIGGLLKSIFSVFVFATVLVLLFIKTSTYGTVQFTTMEEFFADRPITNTLLKVLFERDSLSIVVFLSITIIPFVFGLFLYSLNYGKDFQGYVGKNKIYSFKSSKSGFANMFKKEITYYASTPAYLINTIIGPVMILVLSIMIASMGVDKIVGYLGISLSTDLIVGFLVLLFIGCISMTYISSCSISLEGRKFWILKSSPINEKTLFIAKAFTNFIIVEPFVVLASIILFIALKFSFLQFLCLLFVPTLFTILISFGGLLINIWLPRFDWEREEQVVKQGLSPLLTMIYGLVLTCIPIALYLVFDIVQFATLFMISISIYIVLLLFVTWALFTVGVKRFRKL